MNKEMIFINNCLLIRYMVSFYEFDNTITKKDITMIESLKPIYNTFLRPIARIFNRYGIHPNVLTIFGTLLFLPAAYYTVLGHWRIGVLIGFTGALFDGLDGLVARECNKMSVFGAFLDSVCDRFTEIIWLGCLLLYYNLNPTAPNAQINTLLIFLLVTGALMVSYIRARAEGAGIECNKGLMQRSERLIILAIFQIAGPEYLIWGLTTVAALSYFTVFQRIAIVWKNTKGK